MSRTNQGRIMAETGLCSRLLYIGNIKYISLTLTLSFLSLVLVFDRLLQFNNMLM